MTKPKRKTKKRRRAGTPDVVKEQSSIANKLRDKYGRKGGQPEITTALLRASDKKILNPTKHDSTVRRCVQGYLNKINAPDEPKKFVPRKWLCAFCGLQSCYGDLGDLFGPYYVQSTSFPDYLPVTNDKSVSGKTLPSFESTDDDIYSDVWFHGSCALWAPELMFFAGRFPKLDKVLNTCWKQKCKVCKKIGASIAIHSQPGHLHFPCAISKEYRMEELTLTCKMPLNMAKVTTVH